LKSHPFKTPQLFVRKAGDLFISSENLPILMRAVLDKNMAFRLSARGNSMWPFIQNGDTITIMPISKMPLIIGDVVAFVNPISEKLVVHRIIAKQAGCYRFLGDNVVCRSDGLIPINNLIGKVDCVERNGRQKKLGLGPERHIIAVLSQARLALYVFTGKIISLFQSSKRFS
jgi:signal peptidase I